MKQYFIMWVVLLLSGCAMPTGGSTWPGHRIAGLPAPGVLIEHQSAERIWLSVIENRVKKGMRVKVRQPYSLIMVRNVFRAKKPTQAQIIYHLHPYKEALWLSAKVMQSTFPGTPQQYNVDITTRVQAEIQQELDKIAQQLKNS